MQTSVPFGAGSTHFVSRKCSITASLGTEGLGLDAGSTLTICLSWDQSCYLSLPQCAVCKVGLTVVPTLKDCCDNEVSV